MRILFFVAVMLFSEFIYSQNLTIDQTVSDAQVVDKLLGSGVNATNILIRGGSFSRGVFSNGDQINLGITEGVVIASGRVDEISLPNYIVTSSSTEPVTDVVVSQVFPGSNIQDMAMIEFDFVASTNKLSFDFVFASEEYPDWVCSNFNDIFGFILSEVSPTNTLVNHRNLAKLPNSNFDIAINTVNNGIARGNSTPCLLNNTQYFINNYSNTNTHFVFGGYTVKIPITTQITQGQKYHIKMFVCDVGDPTLNSAVFIEGNSFTTDSTDFCTECIPSFSPLPGQQYLLSAWVKESYINNIPDTYSNSGVKVSFNQGAIVLPVMRPSGAIVDGWQRIEQAFTVPAGAQNIQIKLVNETPAGSGYSVYFDDIRMHPFSSNMKSYVYDPSTQRLSAELDENNYATHYEYDDEGILIRVKKETERGVMTIKETRNNQSKIKP